MSTQPKTYLTPEQYLEIERKAEFKSEYYQGEMFAMAGARWAHNLILLNLASELRQQLRSRPCAATSSDMRVRVSGTGLYTYPDVVVVCGEPRFLDDRRDTLLNPNLIVEILSESTEAYDRGRKFEHYRSLESLSEYLLVSSERVSAELFTRRPDGRWLLTSAARLEDSITLESAGCQLTLSNLYEKVDFTPPRAVTAPLSA
jgi:Uma2 family endonuclease